MSAAVQAGARPGMYEELLTLRRTVSLQRQEIERLRERVIFVEERRRALVIENGALLALLGRPPGRVPS